MQKTLDVLQCWRNDFENEPRYKNTIVSEKQQLWWCHTIYLQTCESVMLSVYQNQWVLLRIYQHHIDTSSTRDAINKSVNNVLWAHILKQAVRSQNHVLVFVLKRMLCNFRFYIGKNTDFVQWRLVRKSIRIHEIMGQSAICQERKTCFLAYQLSRQKTYFLCAPTKYCLCRQAI